MDTKKLIKIEQNIKDLLIEHPRLQKLENRRELVWEYWKRFDGLSFGVTKENWLYRITWPDYITRSLRKVMSKVKEVDNPQRYLEGELFKKKYAKRNS